MIMRLMRHRELWGRGLVTAQSDTLQTQLEIIVISSPWNWLAVFTNVYLEPEHEHKGSTFSRNSEKRFLCACGGRTKKKRALILLFLICFPRLCLDEDASERKDMHACFIFSSARFSCCGAKRHFIMSWWKWTIVLVVFQKRPERKWMV